MSAILDDAEFLKLGDSLPAPAAPPVEGTPEEITEPAEVPEGTPEEVAELEEPVEGQEEVPPETAPVPPAPAQVQAAPAAPAPPAPVTRIQKPVVPPATIQTTTSQSAIDYKAFYDRVMAPLKASGTTVQFKDAEEVVTAAQKGIDYTRKLMDMSKNKKYVMMLEKAELLDENKLELLIGVAKKEPEALKRFFKENKLDPVEIDTTTEDKYQSGTHRVSDAHAKFQEVIDDVRAQDDGQETLKAVNQWDEESKAHLFRQPHILHAIHTHRKNGAYALITAEIARRQALGKLTPGVPYLQTYHEVGEELSKQGSTQPPANATPKTPVPAGNRTPVTRRPASPAPSKGPDKSAVRAAAATRTIPKQTQTTTSNAGLSDSDFLKLMP